MDAADILVIALLASLGVVLGGALGMFYLVRRHLRARAVELPPPELSEPWAQQFARFPVTPLPPMPLFRPARWLAIRSRETQAVQLALGLQQVQPCSWTEGVLAAQKLFIAPPIQGWTLVFGGGLPGPDEDVDECYRFVRELSRKLGQVQFFQAEPVLPHHAWVRAESGRIVRAYAWAGTTLWNQGVKTAAEITLGMNCFAYGENPGSDDWLLADHLVANVEKVFLLAQRWSLDPATIDVRQLAQQPGIAGQRVGRI